MKELKGFKIATDPIHKYVALVFDTTTGRISNIPFGDKRYEHYHDKIGYYKHLDHFDLERRRLFHARHQNSKDKKYTAGWFALNYLW